MTGPVETSSKRRHRIENKKKKMAALLDIVKLNENDRLKVKSGKAGDFVATATQPLVQEKCFDNSHSPSKKLKTESSSEKLGPSGKPMLEGADLMELKKMLREKTTKIRQMPKFRLRDMGENATLKLPLDTRCPLFLSDVQHLLLYSQIGVHSPYSPARWCSLEKYNRLLNVTVLVLENVSLYHYEAFESHFPFTTSNFDHKLEIISPFAYNSDFVKELSMVPLTSTQMKRLIEEYGSIEDAAKQCSEIYDTVNNFFPIQNNEGSADTSELSNSAPSNDKFSRTKLLLSGWQMVEENFPLPIKGLAERKYADYVLTKDSYKNVTAQSPLIALDCEMCKTDTGDLELTRVSVVSEKHEVLYDELVKPQNKIVDYLTRFSGINAKMMRNVTKKLQDVREELRALLPDDAILVGQSLSNDLHALKMMHPYVIDTSVIYNISGDRTRKTKLQTLAREFLEEKIQMGGQGHCSSEDSLACMKLVQLKLKKHPYYGDAVMNSIYSEQRAYPDMGTANYAVSMLKQCVKAGNTARVIGVDDIADKYRFYVDKNATVDRVQCIKAESNRDVVRNLCADLEKSNLNIGHLRVASDQLDQEGMEKTLKKLDKWIGQVHAAANQPALVAVVMTGRREGGNGACFIHLKRDFIP